MNIVELTQGTPEWHAHRALHFNASDAPAMLGCSPYKTRSELLRERATGMTAEVDAGTQRRFDDGHHFEALARPLAEKIIGDDLYPVVGVDGEFSASFDGITMLGDVIFEHKSLNDALRAAMLPHASGLDLPLAYRVQCEHQLMVSKAERCLFMASKWEGETLVEERHCWYESDAALRAEIVAGWKQFALDVAAYDARPAAEPAPVGRAPEALPALRIEINGAVTASNLAEFKQTALAAIHGVNRDLKTDADFANAEKAVKWCSEIEDRLKAAKDHALSQTATIDELFRTMDDIGAEARRVRLDLDKLVKARKDAIRDELVRDARMAFGRHVDALQAELEGVSLALAYPDFAGAIKGKRTIDSLRDAVDTLMAQSKIAANEAAQRIRASLAVFNAEAAAHLFLFADRLQLVTKPAEDVRTLVQARIAKHQADEAARLEAERERIRAEEQAKAQREAERAASARRAEELAAAAKEAERLRDEQDREDARRRALALEAEAAKPAAPIPMQPAPALMQVIDAAPAVAFIPVPAARASEPATLKLGTICDRLGFTLTAAFVADTLGITHSATDKAAKLYRESDFERICTALVEHIARVSDTVDA